MLLSFLLAEGPWWNAIDAKFQDTTAGVEDIEKALEMGHIRILLYEIPVGIIVITCLFFSRSVYELERAVSEWARTLPIIGKFETRSLPEEPLPKHLWYIRILGIFVLVYPLVLLPLVIFFQ
jgi:hypothetical protein